MGIDRRRILRASLGGSALGSLALPQHWVRPVVKSVIVPAHAQASPANTPPPPPPQPPVPPPSPPPPPPPPPTATAAAATTTTVMRH